MGAIILYVTTKDKWEAETIARSLLEERLVACANITDGMVSMYRWQGEIQQSPETVLFLKTQENLEESAINRVLALHSYTTPCILTIKVSGGNPTFLEWIATETVASASPSGV